MRPFGFCLGALAVTVASAGAFAVEIDGRYQPYHRSDAVSGGFTARGSDTLKGLMTVWAQDYRALYPGARIDIESGDSQVAAQALLSGDAEIAPMSHAMKDEDKASFATRHGYPPLEIRVAVEAVAVFVNKDNPISCLSMNNLKAIFSGSSSAKTWGDLGLKGEWASKPLSIYGRNPEADIAAYFNEAALARQGFSGAVKTRSLSSAVVRAIAADASAIGYSSAGYRIGGVKPVAIGDGGNCVAPTERNAYAHSYPLAHFLYLYADRNPSAANSALTQFLRYTLSLDGQQTVIDAGFFPPPYVYAQEDLGKLGSN